MDMEKFPITVDLVFLGQAVTIAMQMRGELAEDEFIEVDDLAIDPETKYLHLLSLKRKMVMN